MFNHARFKSFAWQSSEQIIIRTLKTRIYDDHYLIDLFSSSCFKSGPPTYNFLHVRYSGGRINGAILSSDINSTYLPNTSLDGIKTHLEPILKESESCAWNENLWLPTDQSIAIDAHDSKSFQRISPYNLGLLLQYCCLKTLLGLSNPASKDPIILSKMLNRFGKFIDSHVSELQKAINLVGEMSDN
jgi:hypothetical protein